MAITIKEVAKEAGVATSTVSRTIKDHPSISEETKEKVRKAMKKLGYVPNASAQSLASRKTMTIGIILPVFSNREKASDPFFLEIIREISKACTEKEYTVAIATGDTTEELLESVRLMFLRKKIDGFLLLYSKDKDPISQYLQEQKVPYVMVGYPVEYESNVRYVDNDNTLSGKTATRFLIEADHKKIGFVGFNQQEIVHQARYSGYQSVMSQNNLAKSDFYTIDEASDYLLFQEYLEKEKPTALVAVDDLFALRLMQLLKVAQLKVPDDISIISFNNSIFSTLAHPYLTTIDIHVSELGRQATFQLIDYINGDTQSLTSSIVPHEVIKRETVIRYQRPDKRSKE